MGAAGTFEVGQPSSADSLIGRSPKSACMRHNKAQRECLNNLRKGRKGRGRAVNEEPGMEAGSRKSKEVRVHEKKKGMGGTIRTGVFSVFLVAPDGHKHGLS